MRKKSILLKSIICGSVYLVFSLSIIFAVYIMDFFEITFYLGILCGVLIAAVSYCDTAKRTIVASVMGVLSAFAMQFLLSVSGIPYKIILYILRDDEWVKETGRLTVNEVIGYNFGLLIFWQSLLISFVILVISFFIFRAIKHAIKNRKNHCSE